MNKIFHLTIFVLSLNILSLNAQSTNYRLTEFNSQLKKSEFLLFLAKNYSSNGFSILDKKTYDYYIKWATGKNHDGILSNYAAVIHETCHLVNDDIGGFWTKGYYISPKIELKVSKLKVFKSSELDKNIPEKWKMNIFRYKTYIQESNEEEKIASVSEGIYGLLDEFDAYYQSTRAVVELYDYYKTIASYSEPSYWTLYISNCYSSIFAYHEFSLFIAWYLEYAKKNHPEIYISIIKNKELKIAFTLIDNGYKSVIQQYFNNRNSILDKINKAGIRKAEISDKYFLITSKGKKGNISKGYGIPDGDITYLNSLYTKEDFQMLKLFGIDKLSETNYKVFLK